ncbi:hypothetical protein T05_8356 [Trichinella murrelli]|uniref:Uncharacterized protein n=1 Tax=Trichinella murrelli TaxID=144512 RepID=A0A0V0SZL5_9BILA|nr:hypothetical protein T05_2942 [Trichinella murrelli]KRX32124.1 hypothetical protein T05_8356 [Trichinella murrelli]
MVEGVPEIPYLIEVHPEYLYVFMFTYTREGTQ